MEEQLQDVCSRINQLQAASVPSALHGLLQQAQSLLKPPSRNARGTGAGPTGSAASRRSLVVGILALLEHAALLATRHRDVKLLKDARTLLLSAFQQHSWLWELLLRKHLADLLQHPAAAQVFAEAVARLPPATQARAYSVWRQQLLRCHQAGSPLRVPRGLQQVLLDQLLLCFHASKVSLPALGGSDACGEDAAGPEGQPTDVRVMLRQQLPALLHLLLAVTCSEGAAGGSQPVEARLSQQQAGLSGERASGNAGAAPCISSKQSAASGQRPPPQQRLEALAQQEQQEESTPGAPCPQARGEPSSSDAACAVRDAVLRHAVLLVSRLSDPEALHAMLALRRQGAPECGSAGGGSDSEAEEAGRPQAGGLSRRDASRVQAARALIEVCLDGMLALPPLSHAVHRQLHSKGSSTGGVDAPRCGAASTSGAAAAGAVGEAAGGDVGAAGGEQAAAAALEAEDELRHTAGLLLGMHRELSRLLAEEGAAGGEGGGRTQQAQRMSLPACRRLLHTLAAVQRAEAPAADPAPVPPASSLPAEGNGGSGDGPARRRSLAQEAALAARVPPSQPALLLVPPQLAAQGLELVRQAVAASTSGAGSVGLGDASWHANVAQVVAAIYLACYRAMWGARVLQSAEAYQQLLCAARLRMLLRAGAGSAAGAGEAGVDEEAAAEAALLARNTLGSRRRRAHSAAHEPAGLVGGAAGTAGGGAAAGHAAKRAKRAADGGSAQEVAQLLQLFQPPAPAEEEQQQARRKRIVPIPVAREAEPPAAARAPHVRQLSTQQPLPSPAAAAAAGSLQLASSEAADAQAQALASSSGDAGSSGGVECGAEPGVRQERDHQRFVLSRASALTEEEQEEVWAAYIADKEFLAEMLGDAGYQAWYDEAAHPLRRQQARAGGLEAAWAAVLGGPSAGSLVQRQLPRTLLQATSAMPWDAAAAACLQLLRLLLRGAGLAAGGAPAEQLAARQALLRHAFDAQLRRDGAKAATNALLGLSGQAQVLTAMRTAAAAPAGGAMVALAAHLLGLVRGERSLAELPLFGGTLLDGRQERQALGRQWVPGGARLTAPPLLDAYCRLLALLLPDAQAELAADPLYGSGKPLPESQQRVLPISLAAALATRMLLLPPPTQHMLAPGCPRLLRLAVEGGGGTHAAAQLAALLWMLARGGGAAAPAGLVRLPPRRPAWLEGEALLVEGMRGDAGCGNVLLLGPPRQVAAAAAAELLRQLRRHVGPLGAAGGEEAAEGLAPVADACHAAIQLLLEERQRRAMRGSGAADSGSDDDEEGEAAPLPLLLGQPAAVEELGGLAAELCQAGTAAGAAVAAALSAALGAAAEDAPGGEGGDPAPAAAAAALLAVSNQFLEAADRLLGCGCLAAGAAQRLDGACQQLEGALRQVQRLCLRLPRSHPLLAAVGAAMEAAPALWQPDSEEAGGGSDDDASSDDGGQRAARSAANRAKGSRRRQPAGGSRAAAEGRQPPRGRRRLADVRNPALRAMLAEEGCGAELEAEDLSDLEDFIVCNPGRDYEAFFRQHFWQARGSDGEEGDEEAGQGGGGAATAAPRHPGQQAARLRQGAPGRKGSSGQSGSRGGQ